MLNKLLKRCMPWQQRGRWVRIYIDWTDTNNPPVVKGPDWLNVSVVDGGHGEYNLSYNPDDYYWILDAKLTATEGITSEGDTLPKVRTSYGEIYQLYRSRGYLDLFLTNVNITIEG